jgi:hypothetical protein
VRDYEFLKVNPSRTFFEPRGIPSLLEKLKTVSLQYCVTGSLAAIRRAPIASPRLAIIYVTDIPKFSEALELKQVETGGNVILVEPKSKFPFFGAWEEEQIAYAPLCQVAADLMTSPGRGPNEADALLVWMEAHPEEWRA